jgi:hypothetical protein
VLHVYPAVFDEHHPDGLTGARQPVSGEFPVSSGI